MPLPPALDLGRVEERVAIFVQCLGVLAEALVHSELSGDVVQLLGIPAPVGRVSLKSQPLGPALAIQARKSSHRVAVNCQVPGSDRRSTMSIGKLLKEAMR